MRITSEQRAVIEHPLGKHARVLAVAGSGKTTTLAHRAQWLVSTARVQPSRIQVLMFNKLASEQFATSLKSVGLTANSQPAVNTFHSFAYRLIRNALQVGALPGNPVIWGVDKDELIWLTVNRAITELERARQIPTESVDKEDAREAISLWKGSLIPPERAGHKYNPNIALVYQKFEELRAKQHVLTFDDFVPTAVQLLLDDGRYGHRWAHALEHVIVDEYQDVNYSQQRLIEILAGTRADVMVVGDDDQTIYEWRGARPQYILREFRSAFSNKPQSDYTLSHTFRFGPISAQCAENTIVFNTNRAQKHLIANEISLDSTIDVVRAQPAQACDVNRELTGQIVALVKQHGVRPPQIAVLARMYAQLTGLQAEFLRRKVPFRIIGQTPFYARKEITTLLDYVRLALGLNAPVGEAVDRQFLAVANVPARMLSRQMLSQAIEAGRTRKMTFDQVLSALQDDPATPLSANQRRRVGELQELLRRVHEILAQRAMKAAELLQWLVAGLDYYAHFDDYYGRGENSDDRKRTTAAFLRFAETVSMEPAPFLDYVAALDTTHGAAEQHQIVMTTIFRTKGLEYDYVVIPDCAEGYLPCLAGGGNPVFDTAGQVTEPEESEAIENERRLFYVAITRARQLVLIGAPEHAQPDSRVGSKMAPSRFLEEIQLPETTALLKPLIGLTRGAPDAHARLLAAARQYGGRRRIVETLVNGYLARAADAGLIGEFMRAAHQSPEMPFSYAAAYAAQDFPSGPESRSEAVLEDGVWGAVLD